VVFLLVLGKVFFLKGPVRLKAQVDEAHFLATLKTMKALNQFRSSLQFLLTDIDDTLTDEGLLGREAYSSLWRLHDAGIKIIPVTGRPAGWCEMIARVWPVAGVVGENGGFYFRYHDKKMIRHFIFDPATQAKNRQKLDQIKTEILASVPGADVASDQFCRLMDLAIDFCEDVPKLPDTEVERIVEIFKKHGAQAKVSSIHVNGWFGSYNKVTTSQIFLEKEFAITPEQSRKISGFAGDSPNDEPMFENFPHSFAVANLMNFADRLKHKPQFLSDHRGGLGFVEIAEHILKAKQN
jgi:HAD superfamily hydrolase (TIGR01484 family)